MKEKLETIAAKDGRYDAAAVRFIYEGLGNVLGSDDGTQACHITGQDLSEGIRRLALEKWGRLAILVLNSWGVKTTGDFGQIVYLMIENRWMSAQPEDSIHDFDDVFDFQKVFKDNFEF